MAKLGLNLKTRQRLALTPELRQALKLLQLPVTELSQHLQEALESNVMLELDTESTATKSQQDSEDWQRNTITFSTRSGAAPSDDLEFQIAAPITLHDHLLWQLDTSGFDERQRHIGRIIIDAVDDDGYLTSSFDQLCEEFTGSEQEQREFAAVLEQIQTLDPLGVATESLEQCLTLQLSALDVETEVKQCAQSIVEQALDAVASNNVDLICKTLDFERELVEHAIAIIRSLDPYPGRRIGDTDVDYIIPDVYVRKSNDRWVVAIDDKYIPSIKINAGYAKALNKNEHLTLSTQLREARWLLRSLELRRTTLLRVANAIVRHQHAFFEGGDLCITPLLMKDLAEELELHESTISRVTANKYMHTPRGVVPFRHFFSLGLGGDTGDKTSTVAIQAMMRKLVDEEDPRQPLSDQKLVDALAAKGIDVARRTVAKYRGLLGIGSTAERRRR